MKDIKFYFGKRVRELRLKKNLSQEQLAHMCDLDRTYINSIENGKRNVSLKNIEKILKALDISWCNFFQKIDNNKEG